MSEYIYATNGELVANIDGDISLAREEVIRCRDCKHFTYADAAHEDNDWCVKHNHIGWSVNGFCAWGERREP